MEAVKRALRVFTQMAKVSLASSLAYRANFILNLVITLLSNLLVPLVTVLIYAAGASIPGWSFHEALLVQAAFMLSTGLCSPFFYNMVWVTMQHIRDGSYDLLLIKPGSVLVLSIASSIDPDDIGVFIGGLAMFVYALSGVAAANIWNWLQFACFFLASITLNLGLVLIMSATSFKWVGMSRIFEIYDSITIFGRYPGTVFPKALMFATSFVLPVATLGFLPASALLGRNDGPMLLAIVPCLGLAGIGALMFTRMVGKYRSAGG